MKLSGWSMMMKQWFQSRRTIYRGCKVEVYVFYAVILLDDVCVVQVTTTWLTFAYTESLEQYNVAV